MRILSNEDVRASLNKTRERPIAADSDGLWYRLVDHSLIRARAVRLWAAAIAA